MTISRVGQGARRSTDPSISAVLRRAGSGCDKSRMRTGIARLCLIAIAVLPALGGCAAPEPKTAFVAYGDAGSFGYSDSQLSDNLYQVTYVTPYLRTSSDTAGQEAELAQQKQQAYELALWRAAQLAQKAGFPAFQIENQSRDANVVIRAEPDFVPPSTPFGHYYGPGPFYRPFPVYGYPYGHTSYTERAVAIITAQLRVRMLHAMEADAIDSKATETQLASRYGKATYPATVY